MLYFFLLMSTLIWVNCGKNVQGALPQWLVPCKLRRTNFMFHNRHGILELSACAHILQMLEFFRRKHSLLGSCVYMKLLHISSSRGKKETLLAGKTGLLTIWLHKKVNLKSTHLSIGVDDRVNKGWWTEPWGRCISTFDSLSCDIRLCL